MTNKNTLPKTGVNRLNKLADLLETEVTDKEFNLDLWYGDVTKNKAGCKSVGCACGWAASSPKFRGLKLEEWGEEYVESIKAHIPVYNIVDTEEGTEDFYAAGTYFKLTHGQVQFLFHSDYYPLRRRGRRSVINRIRKFVNDNGRIQGKFVEDSNELKTYS